MSGSEGQKVEATSNSPVEFSPVNRAADRLTSGTRVAHYNVVRLLGSGGMGDVYLAHDTLLERDVAIKTLSVADARSANAQARSLREARSVAALDHPNICSVYEIRQHNGVTCIVMQFVEGETLAARLASGSLPVESALDIAAQMAEALAAAHSRGIIHRDIKPENVMLTPGGRVKVMDFGLAKIVEEPLGSEDNTRHRVTEPGTILGTLGYMSPEQARGTPVDERTDIFSLGVVLYEMITGHGPFEAGSRADVLAAILTREPPPLADHCRDVTPELQSLVSKMLAKDREDRYPSIEKVLNEIRLTRDGLKFSSTPLANTERLPAETTHATRKSIALPTAVSGLLVAALISVIAYLYYSRPRSSTAAPSVRSLAVLPLKSLDGGENYLGLGIADAVIRRISQTGVLTVRPTSSVRRYLNEDTDALTAASQLSTDAVLEGSIQRSGDRLRVSVNLLRTSDSASLWADSFDMTSADVFKIEDTVAQEVASKLSLKLDPAQQAGMQRKYTSDPVAYEYYVKGIYSLDQRGYGAEAMPQMLATIDLFKKAIEVDPNYALAHAQLAQAYGWTAVMVESTNPEWEKLADQEIERSQELDPQLAESHLARAFLLWSSYNGYQIEAAVREVLFAQKLNPSIGHDHLAAWFAHMGLEDAASREVQKVIEIDPTSRAAKELDVNQYYLSGRYDEYLDVARETDPNAKPGAWYLLGKGRLDEAEKAIGRYVAESSDARDVPGYRGLLYALRGEQRAAEAQIPPALMAYPTNDQARHHALYTVACIYAVVGNSREAVRWLRETAATGYPNYPLFERDHYLDRIRQTQDFVQFMEEMRAENERFRSEFQ